MLTESTVYGLTSLADNLDAAGIALRPIPGETIDVIATAGAHYNFIATTPEEGMATPTDADKIIVASKTPNAAGNYPHCLALEQQIELAATTVTRIIDFARNTVNPTVAGIVANVQTRLGEVTERSLTPIDIVQDIHAEVWSTPALDALVGDTAGLQPVELKFPKFMPTLTTDDPMSIIRTGSEIFDADVAALIEHRGVSIIADTYDQFLSGGGVVWPSQDDINPFNGDRDKILVLFLLANYYHAVADVPEGAAVALQEYRLYFAVLRAEMARRVGAVIEQRERNRRNNRLILSLPNVDFQTARRQGGVANIVVNGDVYKDWLASGGDAEVLFGSYVDNNERSPAVLLEKADQYRAIWRQTERLVKMEVRNVIQSRTVEAISYAMSKYISDTADEALPPIGRAQLQKLAQEQVKRLTETMLSDLYCAVRRVVCRTLYAHTDAERILAEVDAQVLANPGIDIRDAALLATIDYVVDWTVSWINSETV